jgi:uridine phosphorylase
LASQGVLNFEMEASAVLTLAALAGCRAGVVCTTFAQRTTGRFVMGAEKDRAESALVEVGLEALHVLAAMDAQTARTDELYWRPSQWTAEMAT